MSVLKKPIGKNASISNVLASGKIIVGNSSNVAAAVTMSGDVTITNAGVTAIKSSVDLTGNPTVPNQLSSDNSTRAANTATVRTIAASIVSGSDHARGLYDASTNLFPSTGGSGTAGAILFADYWIVSVAGSLGGESVAAGTMIISLVNTPGQTASNWDTFNSDFVTGPSSSTDNAVVRFDGITGKLIQNSAVTIADTTGDITAGKYNTVAISGSSTPALAVTGTTAVSGTNTGDQTNISGNAATATALATGRTIGITGDLTYTSPSFNGTGDVTAAGTLATVNSNIGTFGSTTKASVVTVNAKGLVTAASESTVAPAVGSITGLGTGVATTLAINVGSAGAPVTFNGAGGTPSSIALTNATGTAASLTAGTVTTNANLTGDVTSVGNATTLTNAPVIAKVLTGYTSGAGTVSATDSILQAIQKLNGNDATNANLTGVITSSGNATSIASQTGTGTKFVVDTSPTLITPILGVAAATSVNFGGSALSTFETGSWTPTDGSGAGLTLTVVKAEYQKIGNMVFAQAIIVYPATADTSAAKIGSLPFTVVANGDTTCAIAVPLSTAIEGICKSATTNMNIVNSVSQANITNAQLSTQGLNFCAMYFYQ